MSKDKKNLTVQFDHPSVVEVFSRDYVEYYRTKKYMSIIVCHGATKIPEIIIPDEIEHLEIIIATCIPNMKFPKLPESIKILEIGAYAYLFLPKKLPKKITELYIDSNSFKFNVEELPDFSYLKNLRHLYIKLNTDNLKHVNGDIFPIKLEHLDLTIGIKNFPENLPENLKYLHVIPICSTIGDISYLKKLLYLNIIFKNSLKEFPEKLPESLVNLYIFNSSIKCVPDISYLVNLKKFIFSENKIKEFPKKLPDSLIDLNLSHNLIEKVNNTGYLKKLLRLILSGNKIKEFPKKLPESLLILEITNCLIEKVPDLSYIKNLSLLSIFHNPIKSIHNKTPRKDLTIQMNPDFDFRY